MDDHGVARQVLLEHETLKSVTAALRTTIGWSYQGPDLSRNLASLRFVGRSYMRHFQHLIALKEEGGYMAAVMESRPELSDAVAALHAEHARLRQSLSRILARLGRVAPTNRATFAVIVADLSALLDQIDVHNSKEADLLQEALLRDEGGEG